ncbi:MAG: GTPase Era, partial [Clostridia bacterium]|nr:GTPase Era [Clostridia bacterium]
IGQTRDNGYEEKKEEFRSGFVTLMGRPNAGKSTLLNTIVGEKVSIVSWKPQTTRNKIKGIYNEPGYQIIFIDTPGLHKPRNSLGDYMMKPAASATEGIDCIVYLIDGEKGFLPDDKENITQYVSSGYRVIVAVNKVDHITKEKVMSILTEINGMTGITAVVPLSALRNRNIKPLIEEIKKLLSDTIKYYDEDSYTDKNMRFITAEIIREKALRLLDQEVPYGIGVDVREYSYREDGDIIDINADIICEKQAHKPIILGKGGSMIKKIATYARQDLEAIAGTKIFLTLFVRVKDDWRENESVMRSIGYDKKDLS